ncbi:OB-fold putative lipoprotein [Desulfovibrio sp. OttesenSCG-928-C06]|nr:OB-fold putative lipoprotein [Desulfovibrio sp. OttesenSCG-928-C06]
MLRRLLILLLSAGFLFTSFTAAEAGSINNDGGGADSGHIFVAAQSESFGGFVLDRRAGGGILAPDTMWLAFENNKGLADAKFRGKKIDLRGRIKSFAVEKKASVMHFAVGPDKKNNVVCYFEGAGSDVFDGLSKGQTVTIVGICSGKIGNEIVFRNCKIKSRK